MHRPALLVAALLLAGACGPGAAPPATEAQAAYARAASRAEEIFTEGRWSDAAAAWRAAADVAGADPSLVEGRVVALYNLACSESRAGRRDDALAAFGESVALAYGGTRGPTDPARTLRLEHVLVDPDLDPLRAEPAFDAALRPFLAAGEAVVEELGEVAEGPRAAVIVLRSDLGTDAAAALAPWRRVSGAGPWIAAALAGPVRPGDGGAHWLLSDGDTRFAVAKVRETLDRLVSDPRVDRERVYVAGEGPEAATAAWAAALALPDRIAGFAAPRARVLRAADEDDLAAAARLREGRKWTAFVAPGDVALEALAAHGVEARTVGSTDEMMARALRTWTVR